MKNKEICGMQSLAIDLICIDGGTQFRDEVNEVKVTEYAEIFASSSEWPFDTSCDVFFDGVKYYLVDGFHRYHAANRVKRASLKCNVHNGTVRDAIAFALKANARHGLHRSNADKRKAVMFVLHDPEWGKLSSRAIAEMCGVGNSLVSNLRSENSRVFGTQVTDGVIGLDGKSYQFSSGADNCETEEDVTGDTLPISSSGPVAPTKDDDASPKENPEALSAPIQGVASRLDVIVKDLAKLSDEIGGEWLDITDITTQAKALKSLIRSGVFWVWCPDCGGSGCNTCKGHGWLSKARKSFLTQSQQDKLEAGK